MPIRVLMFPHYTYPCTHAMLESIYTHFLPGRGCQVQWVMRSDQVRRGQRQALWHGTQVTLIPKSSGGFIGDVLGGLQGLFDMLRVTWSLRRGEVDIVQVRNEIAPGLVALWLRKRTGARFVFQVSSPDAEFRLRAAREGVLRPRLYHTIRGHLKLSMRRWISRRADAVLAISNAMRDHILRADRVRPERAVAFPLGFDPLVLPDPAEIERIRGIYQLDHRPTIIYFGTLARVRRMEFMVETLARVREHIPNARLLMVGQGDTPKDLEWLREAFAAAGLAGAVVFTGQVSRQDVAALVCQADVAVSPIYPIFEYIISSPTKLLEAMGLGVPVVANTEIPEHVEVIQQSNGGLLADYTAEDFARAIVELLESEARRAEMGRAGQAWVQAHRSYEVLANQIEDLYQQLIEHPQGRPCEKIQHLGR